MAANQFKANSLVLSLSMFVLYGCGGGTSEPQLGAANEPIESVTTGTGDSLVGEGAVGFANSLASEVNSVDSPAAAIATPPAQQTPLAAVEPEQVEETPATTESATQSPESTEPETAATTEPTPTTSTEDTTQDSDVSAPQAALPIDPPENNSTQSAIPTRVNNIGTNVGDVVKIIDQLPVSTAQLTTQMTPIDSQHGYVYVANIEHGPNGDTNDTQLRTVLRQGIQLDDGSWDWKSALIEDRTIHDAWHTAPGIAVDREGTVHIAYNMHNTPWQYKRSTNAHDISDFTFHGQFISQEELDRLKFENKTYFPTFGTAEIHGNQISYPRFAKNNSGDVYVTYRFAAKPKQTFENRMMSSGLSKYDYATKTWNPIGVPVPVESADYLADPNAPDNATVVAGQPGWTSYFPRLMFGPDDELHLSMYWRQGKAGANTTRPCHIYTRDEITFSDISGADLVLPVTADNCSNIGYTSSKEFYSVGTSVMDSEKTPYILTSPFGEPREIVSYDRSRSQWIKESSPDNAVEIFLDHQDTMWALGTGLKVLKRNKGESNWDRVYDSGNRNDCYPRATVNEDKTIAYIHTHACDAKSVSVYAIRLK